MRVIQCSCAVVSGNVFSFIGCVFVWCCSMKLVLWMPEHHYAFSKYTTRVTVLKFVLWPGLAPHERHLAHESRHVLQHKRNVSNISFMTLHPRYCQSWEFCQLLYIQHSGHWFEFCCCGDHELIGTHFKCYSQFCGVANVHSHFLFAVHCTWSLAPLKESSEAWRTLAVG